MTDAPPSPTEGAAFLLSQVGGHAAMRFADQLSEFNLTPALVGILRLLRDATGQSQQALAERLGVLPSRLVALVDDLDQRGLIRRERSRTDRRVNEVQLTADGAALLRKVGAVARAHEASLLAAIDADERATLRDLLTRIADQQGLTRGVHPGYRTSLGGAPAETAPPRAASDNPPRATPHVGATRS